MICSCLSWLYRLVESDWWREELFLFYWWREGVFCFPFSFSCSSRVIVYIMGTLIWPLVRFLLMKLLFTYQRTKQKDLSSKTFLPSTLPYLVSLLICALRIITTKQELPDFSSNCWMDSLIWKKKKFSSENLHKLLTYKNVKIYKRNMSNM